MMVIKIGKRKRIVVTPDHIKLGIPGANKCPIALAGKDVFKTDVEVGYTYLGVRHEEDDIFIEEFWDMSHRARSFIVRFDSRELTTEEREKSHTFYLSKGPDVVKQVKHE